LGCYCSNYTGVIMAQIILTGSGTFNLPSDWNDADNVIEMYGAGGNGATSGSASFSGGGGGGGGYVRAVNVPLKASDLVGYVTDKTYDANQFGGLWNGLQGDSEGSPIYGRLLAGGSGFSASGITGGGGNAASFCVINNISYATISRVSVAGGNGRASTIAAGGGGGGAGGPNGVGGAGGTNTATLGTIGRGGGGGNGGTAGSSISALGGTAGTGAGAGGTGGAANISGSAGGAGTSVYSGGGGGGAGDGALGTSGGAGGLYGGGGGGSGSATNSVGGAGASGIIIITYTPLATGNFFFLF
jgi:hypothetical protein